MKKYVCNTCGYIYDEEKGDPDNGIAPGTKWEDLPEDFVCPLCAGRGPHAVYDRSVSDMYRYLYCSDSSFSPSVMVLYASLEPAMDPS